MLMDKFLKLGLSEEVAKSLVGLGIEEPTDIQEKAIPEILNGKNVIGKAETGTGKTLAYLLPIIEKIDDSKNEMQAIILSPTHELGVQINNVLNDLKRGLGKKITSTTLVGSGNIKRQIEKLKNKPHILVGTTGRILELINKKKITTNTIKTIVIDEGDKLLDFINIKDVKSVVKSCPRDTQKLIFSATMNEKALETADELIGTSELIQAKAANKVNENIEHGYFQVELRDKIDFLRKLIHAIGDEKKIIVFINNSYNVHNVIQKLKYNKIEAVSLHGSDNKMERKKALQDFRSGKAKILITSDVSARGLDIKGATHIVNLDIPMNSQNYLHRVGRVGRAGEKGFAYSLADYKEEKIIVKCERQLKIKIPRVYLYEGKIHETEVKKVPSNKNNSKKKSNLPKKVYKKR